MSKTEPPLNLNSFENHSKEKRDGSCESAAKRPRCGLVTECAAGVDLRHLSAQDGRDSAVLMAVKLPRSSKLSRTRRLRQQSGSSGDLQVSASMNDCSQSLQTPDLLQGGIFVICWLFKKAMTCSVLSKFEGNTVRPPSSFLRTQSGGCPLDRQIQSSAFK